MQEDISPESRLARSVLMVGQWTIIGGVPAIVVLSFAVAGKGQLEYWSYQQDCQQLLRQASNSGIVSSAVTNLSKALPWGACHFCR